MIALLQRVTEASVAVGPRQVGQIGPGLLVLACAERGDSELQAERLVERMLAYRMFSDAAGKMNLSLQDIRGDLLLVPQFTLAADTHKGNRPSFTPAAAPQDGKRLFEHLLAFATSVHSPVASGVFGAHMRVALTNDGPVTFWLRVGPASVDSRRSQTGAERASDPDS